MLHGTILSDYEPIQVFSVLRTLPFHLITGCLGPPEKEHANDTHVEVHFTAVCTQLHLGWCTIANPPACGLGDQCAFTVPPPHYRLDFNVLYLGTSYGEVDWV